MNLKSYLESIGVPSIKHTSEKINELQEQFLEMSQLKSDFDIEKFTVKREGNFIAHNFHFLMRQYSLTLYELKRMLLDQEELLRKMERLESSPTKVFLDKDNEEKYVDIEIERVKNRLGILDLDIANKAISCDRFDKIRLAIIKENNGIAPTNEQYQLEEPHYWKWSLSKKAIDQHKQRITGISEGVWENIQYLEEPALLNSAYQVKMLNQDGTLDMQAIQENVHKQLNSPETKKLI